MGHVESREGWQRGLLLCGGWMSGGWEGREDERGSHVFPQPSWCRAASLTTSLLSLARWRNACTRRLLPF